MDAIPPSYEEATRPNPLLPVAKHLGRQDLCRATRVCKHWYESFAPSLWGNPALHLDPSQEEVATVLDSFSNFLRSLHTCRISTASLVHTIHVPPYMSVHPGLPGRVLAERINLLPALQSLIISNVALFDHAALISYPVHHIGKTLRLLVARNCMNMTPSGLTQFLASMPLLNYLDLSYTTAASHSSVIYQISQYKWLAVLKLRRVGLRLVELLALSSLIRGSAGHVLPCLRSLDIRDNAIELSRSPLGASAIGCPHSRNAPAVSDTEQFEASLLQALTLSQLHGANVDLGLDSQLAEGITHWYLSGNYLGSGRIVGADLIKFNARVLDIVGLRPREAQSMGNLGAMLGTNASVLAYLRISCDEFLAAMRSWKPRDEDSKLFDAPPSYEETASETTPSQPVPRSWMQKFPALNILVLSDIPTHTSDFRYVEGLKDLILQCAQMFNGSRTRFAPVKGPAMKCLRLEVVPAKRDKSTTASSTEDPDSELLWNAAQDDFSFFEGEKPSSPVRSPISPYRFAQQLLSPRKTLPLQDVVAELAKWRRERREAFETGRGFTVNRLISEHWPGKVQIIPSSSLPFAAAVQEEWDKFASLASSR